MSIIGGIAGLVGGGLLSMKGNHDRRRAIRSIGTQAMTQYGEMADRYGSAFSGVLERYSADRAANIGAYRAEMDRARSDYTRYFEQARGEYAAGMERAIGEMRTGRESTIELQRQQTARAEQRARSMNAFTGLAQSSFGQSRVEGIGRQGVLQEGAIREQYAQQLSALEAQRASGMSTLSAQMGSGLANIGQQQAGGISNIYQSYSGNMAQMGTQALANEYNMRQRGLDINFQFQGQAANMVGSTSMAFGNALSSLGGAMLGGGLNNMFPSAGGGAGMGGGYLGGGGGGTFGVNTTMPPMASWYSSGYGQPAGGGYPPLGQ